jgi:RNA polymerase sigma factor (sigma-70 family)
MANSRIEPIIQHLRRTMLRCGKAGLTDGQLLERFVADRDAAAFEALVRRHGRMVLGVCRRVLGDPHDADDCFQATFLVLVRKAASVSPPERVGNWLYGVAHTTAVRVRSANAKRRRRETHVAALPEHAIEDSDNELPALLDEELAHLPDKYRTAIVLCDLEGHPRKEVALQLHIPEGTLSSRLTTARQMLAKRLTRHGLAVSAGSMAAALSQQAASACVPGTLLRSTVEAGVWMMAGKTTAGAVVSFKVATLMEGAIETMLLSKLKLTTAATLLAVLIVGGAGVLYRTTAAEPAKQSTKDATTTRQITAAKPAEELEDVTLHGETPEEYNRAFDTVLDALDDYFEIAYANRYEGRIETRELSVAVRRRAVVTITTRDEGGWQVCIRVETQGKAKGRDTLLEQAILRRLLEADRRSRKERTNPAEDDGEKGDQQSTLRLANVHLDAIDGERKISIVTLSGGPTNVRNLAVARDAKIEVKGGSTFAKLKIGMRLLLELQVRDNQLVVTGIRQEGKSIR